MINKNQFKEKWPDNRGYFGAFGGRFVPETLMPSLYDLEEAYHNIVKTKDFQDSLQHLLISYAGRPTPLFKAERLSRHINDATVYLKREDLLHTGAHKINNTIGCFKPSYWRIDVPVGVAGNCTGNIIFGATTAVGS